jgi:hypothetical protein
MNPTKLKMQPTIHLQSKPEYFARPFPGLLCNCIVGCFFYSLSLHDVYTSITLTVRTFLNQ